ncbi:wax ester/triacylglycerol synthase domain-containing protein [Nocardia brasiliensis]|uniref:wax ester/triacylglycerol synthase domain-containing protein n=1 Tax=Nocardia brasiliensis TaxID=37326 RepID=UPI0033FF79C3
MTRAPVPGRPARSRPPVIDRANPVDLTVMVDDRGSTPMHLGAILLFDSTCPPDPAHLRTLLAERISRIPRFRQTLRRTPFGCGRPIWVDDPYFTVDQHLQVIDRTAQVSESELFDLATGLLCTPLAKNRPLWRAGLMRSPGRWALVVVAHHVLTDGIGGLAVLAALADEGVAPAESDFPRPPPSVWALAADAARTRLRALRSMPHGIRKIVVGLRELGFGWTTMRPVERISLNQPTSPRRRLTRVTVDLADILATAHSADGTVNDVVLAAISGALFDTLRARGERPRQLVFSVPVSGRRVSRSTDLGNDTGVRPIAVPAIDDDSTRLADITAVTNTLSKTTIRASSAAPLGGLFRMLQRTGLFQSFIAHQRLIHTFETNLRGPGVALHLDGSRIEAIVPMVATPGNVGVTFAVLSYAGTLGVTVIADPDILTEQSSLTDALATRFRRIGATTPRQTDDARPAPGTAGRTCG